MENRDGAGDGGDRGRRSPQGACTLNTLDSEGINGYSKGHANMWSGILVRHY